MGIDEIREFRRLKRENGRLKKLLADRDVEIDATKEVMGKRLQNCNSGVATCGCSD